MVLTVVNKFPVSSSGDDDNIEIPFANRYARISLPRFTIPKEAISQDAAYQSVKDQLMLDGNPRLELGSVVAAWMEPECNKLIMENISKNYIDLDAYPATTELQNRCVNIIAHLFHVPGGDNQTAIGTSTVGSSEAAMLAGLALKRKWQHKRKLQGKPFDKPNMVVGANLHVCWEKFANYFEVELKEVKLEVGRYVMDPYQAVKLVDENTICVVAILGSTLTGEFEDVKLLNELLIYKGYDTPIHVDAASGGFIAPFLYPKLEWDFRLPLVKSINVSGHKYGFVYPGVGWVVWRSKDDLPNDLIFPINYLGSQQNTFTFNFSKGSSQIIAQYYQFIRFGFEGYKITMENCRANANLFKEKITRTGWFDIISKDVGVPLVAFSLKDSSRYTAFQISTQLRRFGWMVPAYPLAPNAQQIVVLRVVIREDFTHSLAERLAGDIKKVVKELEEGPPQATATAADVANEIGNAETEMEILDRSRARCVC